mgnify:FL=1|tara:strand:- start:2764 stop:3423 length:660 start_codon:yes stop_codon:yes gene_type:complete
MHQISNIRINIENISISLIWLFHVSGILGIVYGNSNWFISFTPLNLTLSFTLLLINCNRSKQALLIIIISFLVGMITEILGVQYGWIFGDYQYGNQLGTKVFGVPLLIGVNWSVLTLITGAITQLFYSNIIMRIILAVAMMIFLDLLIEPLAPVLDFWVFDEKEAPLQNYLGWGVVALFLQFIYCISKIKINGSYPFHLYLLQIIFFSVLLIKHTTVGL